MPDEDGHRRSWQRDSGRYQVRYRGPDGLMRSAPETLLRRMLTDTWLLLRHRLCAADGTRGASVRDYAAAWMARQPAAARGTGWLLKRHVTPHLGNAELGKLNTQMIRAWQASLLAKGVLANNGGQDVGSFAPF